MPEIVVEQPSGTALTDGSSSVDLGNVIAGQSGTPLAFVVRNNGTLSLTGLAVTKDGTHAADFVLNTAALGATLAPGANAAFTVRFTPAATAVQTATLAIASNDPEQNPFLIGLTGSGVTPSQVAQQAYAKASNAAAEDTFGYAVAISGDTVVVGAPGEDSSATGINGNQTDDNAASAGAAYVFARTGTNWVQQAYLKPTNSEMEDGFGLRVAIADDIIVVGAPYEDSSTAGVNGIQADNDAPNAGAAYVFARSGGVWTQQAYLKASNPGAGDGFGSAMAVSGETVVVGAQYEASDATGINGNQTDNSAFAAGAAYVFVRSGASWSQQAYLKASNTGPGDRFAASVGLSGNTIVVGGPYESSSSTGIDGDGGNDLAVSAGAAYVFVLPQSASPVSLGARLENGDLVLTWPKVTPAYRAETSSTIGPAARDPAPGTPVENGNIVTLRLPISASPAFFRLRSP